MIADLLEALAGLWLVCTSVLNFSSLKASGWTLIVVGIIVFALAAWPRGKGHLRWQSVTGTLLGGLLLLAGTAQLFIAMEPMTFWIAFWTGLALAILSLWGAIYRPGTAEA